jgi:hypothetical protein
MDILYKNMNNITIPIPLPKNTSDFFENIINMWIKHFENIFKTADGHIVKNVDSFPIDSSISEYGYRMDISKVSNDDKCIVIDFKITTLSINIPTFTYRHFIKDISLERKDKIKEIGLL